MQKRKARQEDLSDYPSKTKRMSTGSTLKSVAAGTTLGRTDNILLNRSFVKNVVVRVITGQEQSFQLEPLPLPGTAHVVRIEDGEMQYDAADPMEVWRFLHGKAEAVVSLPDGRLRTGIGTPAEELYAVA